MKMYSLYKVTDGKWEIILHIRENEKYEFSYEPRPDIRAIVDTHYDEAPHEMAKILMEQVLHCEAVEVHTLSGQGFFMSKHDAD